MREPERARAEVFAPKRSRRAKIGSQNRAIPAPVRKCQATKHPHHNTAMLLAFIDFSFETLLWGVLALLVVYLARQIFTPPPPPPRPRPPKPEIVLREYSKEELSRCTGADPSTPILVAIKGKIYDVTRGRSFYGPGGAYPYMFVSFFVCTFLSCFL